jgi:hypothetical protein
MDPAQIMEKATAFASAHVAECSRELLVWHETSVLPQGRVRELGAMLKAITGSNHLDVAKSLVVTQALKLAAKP